MPENKEEFEERLLSLLLKDLKLLSNVASGIRDEWFSTVPYRWLCGGILEHFKMYGTLFDFPAISSYLKKEGAATKDIEDYHNLFLFLLNFDVKADQFEFLKEKVIERWRSREFLNIFNSFLNDYERGDHARGQEQVVAKILSLGSQYRDLFIDRGEVFEDFEARKQLLQDKRDHPEKYKGILTGIKQLDATTGGLWKGELGCIFGRTNIGKSILALCIAKESYYNGYQVLYIVEEMPKMQIALRFDANLSNIDYEKFKNPLLLSKGEQDRWEYRVGGLKEKHEAGARLFIHHIPINCDLAAVGGEIEYLRVREKRTPDLVIVDDLDLMAYPKKFSREEGQVSNSRGLKGIAGKYDLALWFTTQQASASYKKQVLDVNDVAFAKGKVHAADTVIGLEQNEEEKMLGRMTLQMVKYRDGPVGKKIYLTPNLDRAIIHAEEFVEKLDGEVTV